MLSTINPDYELIEVAPDEEAFSLVEELVDLLTRGKSAKPPRDKELW